MAKWKFRQIEPQPARGTLKEEMWDSSDWVAEEKYDGDRRIAQFCGKLVRFTGRRKSVKDGLFVEKTGNVPHLAGLPSYQEVPRELEGTVLDGEIVWLGKAAPGEGRSKYVTSIMGSTPEEAAKKQLQRGWLKYAIFDCLFYKGKDVRKEPYILRRLYALEASKIWDNPYAELAAGDAALGTNRHRYETIVANGGEGVILKHKLGRYGEKQMWVKVKREATYDVVILGFKTAKAKSKKVSGETSETKYAKAGLIGALRCGQFQAGVMREVATVSGFPDDLRERISANPKAYEGLVIEITANGREPTGRFRHPRFSRPRPDKSAADCSYNPEES